jgi:hypothetical protein
LKEPWFSVSRRFFLYGGAKEFNPTWDEVDRRRSAWGFVGTRPTVRSANTRYAGRQGLSAYTYLPRVDLEGSFRRVRFALACRTEPLLIILRQKHSLRFFLLPVCRRGEVARPLVGSSGSGLLSTTSQALSAPNSLFTSSESRSRTPPEQLHYLHAHHVNVAERQPFQVVAQVQPAAPDDGNTYRCKRR